MAGFIRRYEFFPGVEVISLIEGVIIVDLPPPGSIQGVSTGVFGLVGEFPDVSTAVQVDGSGNVTSKPVPIEVFTAQDLASATGSFDPTLGDFGVSMGNGFVALRNKQYSRLVVCAVNLASPLGTRMWRQLATNQTALVPQPILPNQAAQVAAGYQFKTGANRVNVAQRTGFTGLGAYLTGVDGAITAVGAAVTQIFVSAGSDFVTAGVQVGDILVLGVISGAGALGANANTYRVNAVTDSTHLVVEQLDGSSWNWSTGTAQPFRLHPSSDADTGQAHVLSAAGGATIPARPLDSSIAASTVISPAVPPPAGTATSWDPLSGLKMSTSPTSGGLVYTAAIQGVNPASSASIDALYTAVLDGFAAQDNAAARDVGLIAAARHSTTINAYLKAHALAVSAVGRGRDAILSPPLSTQTVNNAIAASAPGVGANRDERVFYAWPGEQTFVPEAVNIPIARADGGTTVDGLIDVPTDTRLASVLSNLPPENNPGQSAPPVPQVMATVAGIQRGVSGLQMNDYIALKQNGVVSLRIDRTAGAIFQSGNTTSLVPGLKNINRRRMADFIEDSIAEALNGFSKLPLTNDLKDSAAAECVAFLEELLSANNPAAQRINAYQVDTISGNTPALEAQGIFVIIVRVRTLATADFIVLQAQIGEGVVLTTQLS